MTTSPAPSSPPHAQVLICANPYSGSGLNRRHVDQLIHELAAHDLTARVVWNLDDRRELLTDAGQLQSCRCIVCAGGDGSLNSIINELAAAPETVLARVPLALIPIGTENLFARHFGYTLDMPRLARAIAVGRSRVIDLGAANGRLFTLMVSAGFDAHIVHRMAAWREFHAAPEERSDEGAGISHAAPEERSDEGAGMSPGITLRRINRWSYARHILAGLRDYRYPRVTIEVDGSSYTGSHAFVFNLPRYAANLGVCPHARGDDQMLDWVLFEKPGFASIARYLTAVIRGNHLTRFGVRCGRASAVRIASAADSPVPVQMDGDPFGFTPVHIEVRPNAMRVIDTTIEE